MYTILFLVCAKTIVHKNFVHCIWYKDFMHYNFGTNKNNFNINNTQKKKNTNSRLLPNFDGLEHSSSPEGNRGMYAYEYNFPKITQIDPFSLY